MKQEPSLGNLITFFSGNSSKRVDHDALVEEALDAFTKAEQKMSAAIDTINVHIDNDHLKIKDINQRIESSNKSKDRLTRVLDRVRALTA